MSTFSCEIIKHIAVLSESGKAWQKELNFIRWGTNKPKYDIREWTKDHKKMGKGITLTQDELEKAVRLLQQNLKDIETKKNGMFLDASTYGCELLLECGVISVNKSGWVKEVNIVKWGEKVPCFDLRSWGPEKKIIGKGTTLNLKEAMTFIETIESKNYSSIDTKHVDKKLAVNETSIDDLANELFLL